MIKSISKTIKIEKERVEEAFGLGLLKEATTDYNKYYIVIGHLCWTITFSKQDIHDL